MNIEKVYKDVISQTKNKKSYLILIKPDFVKKLKKQREVMDTTDYNVISDLAGIELIETKFIDDNYKILEFDNELAKIEFKMLNFV